MTRRAIEGNYARLKGLNSTLIEAHFFTSKDHATDFSSILEDLRSECDDEFLRFDLLPHTFIDPAGSKHRLPDPMRQAYKAPIRSKVLQLLSYLENVHNASNRIVEIDVPLEK